jgi:hypothetical protein
MYARRFIECLSKWIVFEGHRWQTKKSVNVIIDNPASQGQSNTTTNPSAKQNKTSDAQTTASQRAGGTKPESKHPNPTQYQDGAYSSERRNATIHFPNSVEKFVSIFVS